MNHSIFSDCKGSAFFQVWPFIFSRSYPCVIHRFSYLCRTKQKLMVQIDDVIVSLDVFREKFLCDLHACKGECCIEGDAGAPVELEEVEKLEEVLPVIWDDLAPEAQEVINRQGVVYTDEEGDLVTSIVNGKDCVFTCYDEKGYCYCAIEKAYREGKCNFYKPISCHQIGRAHV